jgi:CheY-like chemotaxis protein
MTDRLPIVLVVDDDELVAKSIRRVLRGFIKGRAEVEIFLAPRVALRRIDEILRIKGVDVVLVSDGSMPGGMLGPEFLDVAATKLGPRLLGACLVSSTESLRTQAEAMGFKTFKKPFDSNDLMHVVASFLPRS